MARGIDEGDTSLRRRPMTGPRVASSAHALAAHALLLCFTLLLALKLDRRFSHSWWIVFIPLWLFHAVVSRGDIGGVSWWDLFINFGIAQCFAFLVCTKWSNPQIGTQPSHLETTSFTLPRYSRWYCGSSSSSLEDYDEDRLCGLQDTGSYVMKVPLLIFQVLLCMRLEGTPPGAQFIPIFALFSPIFFLQVTGISVALWRLLEKIVLLVHSGSINERYVVISSKIYNFFTLVHHGSRLLSWWSIDERSNEEKARLYHAGTTGYDTFSGYAPEMLKKMPKKVLIKEVSRLQVVLGEQTEIAKNTQEEYERLQNERVLCRICFEKDVCIVLLPCRHCALCQPCSTRCQTCPICRVPIKKRITINDRGKLNHSSDQDRYVDLKSIMYASFA